MTIITPAPTDWKPGRITAYRADDSANALAPLIDDSEDRVVIEVDVTLDDGIERGKYERTDPWRTAVDAITGLAVEVRRAPCGSGCRCAAEVRVRS